MSTLSSRSARVTLRVERTKGSGDREVLITGDGIAAPAARSASMNYDLSALFTFPDSTPSPSDRFTAVWNDEHAWFASPPDAEVDWTRLTRADARESGGLIGRMPDELYGLLEIVAGADADQVSGTRSPGAGLASYVVLVPVEDAVRSGVPADTPHAEVVRDVYGIDEIPFDVTVADGLVRAIGYTFAREKAPYGGPDRTTVTYAWDGYAEVEPPVVPPSGKVEVVDL